MGPVEVFVTRRRGNRNMYLRVKPPRGRVEVSAPMRASKRSIADFVRSRAEWIHHQRKVLLAQGVLLQREILLQGDINQQGNLFQQGESLLQGEGAFNQDRPRLIPVTVWDSRTREEAKTNLRPRVEGILATYRQTIGRQPEMITFRAMMSRWGSCTPATGRIRINLALAAVPDPLVEYVAVHELTHLYERGHGKNFRDRMDLYLPDWRSRRRELNQYSIY